MSFVCTYFSEVFCTFSIGSDVAIEEKKERPMTEDETDNVDENDNEQL